MNTELIEKISKIAERYSGYNNTNENYQTFKHKFVELVVNECSKICSNFKYSEEGPSENAAYQRALCSTVIKEHFGVLSKGPVPYQNIR